MRAVGDLGSEAGGLGRRVDILLFAFVLVLAGYFYNGWGWNQTARYDAIWAFVEPGPHQGTVRIDDFLVDAENGINTGDWARNDEHSPHYYANKAPGTTLLGIPFYGVLYGVESAVGVDPAEPTAVLVNAYLIHLWVTVLPLALSVLFFRRIVGHLGVAPRRAVALTLLVYSGTLLLPFSTAFWGHTTAAAFVVMALGCFLGDGRGASLMSNPTSPAIAVMTAAIPARMPGSVLQKDFFFAIGNPLGHIAACSAGAGRRLGRHRGKPRRCGCPAADAAR